MLAGMWLISLSSNWPTVGRLSERVTSSSETCLKCNESELHKEQREIKKKKKNEERELEIEHTSGTVPWL